MTSASPGFSAPSAGERIFNRIFGMLVGLGLGFRHNYLLQVRGRKSGKLYSTPIDLLEINGQKFLVAPRGRTQWVRNAEAANEVTLKRGSVRARFRLRPLQGSEKLLVLKAYLDKFHSEVQRFFQLPAGSPAEAFRDVAESHPAFELLPI